MKAIQVREFGDSSVLVYRDVERPQPGPAEVLLRVFAAGVNPADWYARAGFPAIPEEMRPQLTLPFIPGSDVSGVVEKVGSEVTKFREGDSVFGLVRFPQLNNGGKSYAEFVTAPEAHLALKPENIDHLHAAATPMAALTAYQYLFDHAQLESNRNVLVNGAAGGVGHFAVQFAKMKGANVIGVASGRHERFLRDLDVDVFVDYTSTTVEELARDIDLVVDTVGGPQGYRFLSVVKPGGTISPVFLGEYHRSRAKELGISFKGGQVHSDGTQMVEIARLLQLGQIRTQIDSIYLLREASLAHQRGEKGHIQGKIVLQIAE